MSTEKAKGILAKIKELFEAATLVAPVAPVVTQTFTEYKLTDGTSIGCDKMEVGGAVTVGGVQATAGEYALEDGSSITVDEAGMITAIKPVVVPAPAAPVAPALDMSTPEGMRAASAKFAVGTPEERVANLETLCKALMEYSFGWQLREAAAKQTTDAAIEVYKNLTDQTSATVTASAVKMEKQEQLLKQMFELMNEVVGLPTGDPPVVAGKKKFSFADVDGRKKTFGKFQAAAAKLSEQWKEIEKVA